MGRSRTQVMAYQCRVCFSTAGVKANSTNVMLCRTHADIPGDKLNVAVTQYDLHDKTDWDRESRDAAAGVKFDGESRDAAAGVKFDGESRDAAAGVKFDGESRDAAAGVKFDGEVLTPVEARDLAGMLRSTNTNLELADNLEQAAASAEQAVRMVAVTFFVQRPN